MLPRCSFKEVAQSACCSTRGPKYEVFEYSLILKTIMTGADENSIKTHMNGGEQRTALTGKNNARKFLFYASFAEDSGVNNICF